MQNKFWIQNHFFFFNCSLFDFFLVQKQQKRALENIFHMKDIFQKTYNLFQA